MTTANTLPAPAASYQSPAYQSGRCPACRAEWLTYTDASGDVHTWADAKTQCALCREALPIADARPAPMPIPSVKVLDDKAPVLDTQKPLDIADGRFCSDCKRRGPAWKVDATCEQFCFACTGRFIQWQEGELQDGYAAAALLAKMPEAKARPYRLLRHRPCYQIAASEAA